MAILSGMPTKLPLTTEKIARSAGHDHRNPTNPAWAALAARNSPRESQRPHRSPPRSNDAAHPAPASVAPAARTRVPSPAKFRKRKRGGAPGRRAGWNSTLSQSTFEQLLQAAQSKGGQRSALLCALVLGLGLRPSDIARLERRHVIEGERGLNLFIAREGAARVLPTHIQFLLRPYLGAASTSDRPLFIGRRNAPLSANAIQQQIRRAAKRQGLELSSSAGRRAQLQDIDLSPALKHPALHARVNDSAPSAGMAEIQKVERYRAALYHPTLLADLAAPSGGRRTPRRYR